MGGRLYAYVVSAAVIVAVTVPVSWHPFRGDSFPLSTYPMFSRPRPKPMLTANYALGIDADGTRHHLAPKYVANVEVLQARAIIDRTINSRDPKRRKELCQRIAARVVAHGGSSLARVATVRIVRGTHDAVEYLTGRNTEGREVTHVQCEVKR